MNDQRMQQILRNLLNCQTTAVIVKESQTSVELITSYGVARFDRAEFHWQLELIRREFAWKTQFLADYPLES